LRDLKRLLLGSDLVMGNYPAEAPGAASSVKFNIKKRTKYEKKAPNKHQEEREPFPGNFDQRLQQDLAENTLLALVRTGIENDFEQVVFPIHPSLRDLKRLLLGSDLVMGNDPAEAPGAASSGLALYAALSGSGSALFGLYRSEADAKAAQQRVQAAGCKAVMTHTLPRTAYWRTMFAG
jgi:4-diphosphocytidyl-2-C-methyl-D-erythritol kinase